MTTARDGKTRRPVGRRPGPGGGAPGPVPGTTPARCCPPLAGPEISPGEAASAAALFKALADPHRVEIVNLLARRGEACVCDVQAAVGLAQPTVSFHLRKLAEAGLLVRETRGVWAYYSVDREALARLAQVFGEGTT
ncbi:MAG TPA: metalloregulator ArsR/SmtB family transcription factor [Actinomycetota bacterium]|nr:metalloregulator ArsR/SmtB family transcription factor [Actinomycetota bacterium]